MCASRLDAGTFVTAKDNVARLVAQSLHILLCCAVQRHRSLHHPLPRFYVIFIVHSYMGWLDPQGQGDVRSKGPTGCTKGTPRIQHLGTFGDIENRQTSDPRGWKTLGKTSFFVYLRRYTSLIFSDPLGVWYQPSPGASGVPIPPSLRLPTYMIHSCCGSRIQALREVYSSKFNQHFKFAQQGNLLNQYQYIFIIKAQRKFISNIVPYILK